MNDATESDAGLQFDNHPPFPYDFIIMFTKSSQPIAIAVAQGVRLIGVVVILGG